MTKIVSIHSFRGGTGKSNLTANIAVTVARMGQRVGVIDTDIQSPGIHVLFGMDEEKMPKALNDYLWGNCRIEETAYDVSHVAGASEAGGSLHLIPSSVRTGEIARVLREGYDVGLLNDGFRGLIRALKLDYLFIDTHPGVNEETLLSIAISDILLLILRPDAQDFQGTAVTVELARRLEVRDMHILINKVPPGMEHGALARKVESMFEAPVAAVFPLNMEMARLASGGIFSLQLPDHPFSHEVRRVAARITTPTLP